MHFYVTFGFYRVSLRFSCAASLEEAKEALLGLGYSAKRNYKDLEVAGSSYPGTTQEALKVAFKLLMK